MGIQLSNTDQAQASLTNTRDGPRSVGRALNLDTYLDASRIQALDHLFNIPGQQGVDIFTRLLAYALLSREVAPASPPQEAVGQYAALMSVESLYVLGKMINCNSNETISKYMKLFTICGFIEKFKVKHSRRVYLAFPAGPYVPPSTQLGDLDALLAREAKRPKVKALVRQVRDRCIAHNYVTGKALGLADDVPSSLQHILTILQSEQLESTQRITKAVSMLTKLLVTARTPSTWQVDATASRPVDSSRTSAPVASLPLERASESPLPVDASLSEQGTSERTATKSTREVDLRQDVWHDHRIASPLSVDASFAQPTQKGIKSPCKVDANLFKQENVVDVSPNVVDSGDPANVNVITFIQNITFNVKLVAMFCCRVLDEPPKKWPIYRKLFQSPEVENDVQAITAALLFVLAHRDDGSMRNPASVFIARCKDFHAATPPSAKVFAEAMSLVERYGQLPYGQLIKQLSAQRAQAAQVQAWQPEQHTTAPYQTPAGLKPIPSGITPDLEVHIELAPGGGMTLPVAQRLRGEMAHDIRFGRCRVMLVALKDGSYGVLVDKTEEQKVRQYAFYAEQEWQQRSATLKSCYELFGEGGTQGLALLKKALKKYE